MKVGVVIKQLEAPVQASKHTYAVVIEPAGIGFSAYVPDLPGCVAAASSREAVLDEIRAAIQLLQGQGFARHHG